MNQYNTEQFEKDLKEFNIILNERQLFQFIQYYEILIQWNSFMNLTAITDFNEIMKKHFLDSLSIIKAIDLNSMNNIRMIDVGTGAGFPGIPLKIVFPELSITLLDSLQKRIHFLDDVIEKLELDHIEIIHGRAEDYAKPEKLREKFDIAVSRAVANLSTLSEYCLPFVKVNGLFISYKSEKLNEELESAKKAVSILGGMIQDQKEFILPNSDIKRNILVVKKTKVTPHKFPRKAGIPSKEPIF